MAKASKRQAKLRSFIEEYISPDVASVKKVKSAVLKDVDARIAFLDIYDLNTDSFENFIGTGKSSEERKVRRDLNGIRRG